MSEAARTKPADKQPGWMASCFQGRPRFDLIFPYPTVPPAEKETIQVVVDALRKFAPTVDAARIDREAKVAPEVVRGIAEMGLFGVIIPEAYGGLGLSYTGYLKVMEEYGYLTGCMSTAALIGAHSSIGLKPILEFGSEALKRKYLPRLATGEWIAAFALTEPNAGSDAGALKTKATLNPDGPDGSWILNGSKVFITNGGVASVFTVFARTPDDRISCFVVEKGFPGFTIGPEEKKMGIKGSSTTTLYFENTPVPAENLVGEAGQGFKVALNTLNSGRLGLGGAGVGQARLIAERCAAYAKERRQFNIPIGEFELIKEKFAEMRRDVFALESAAFLTARYADRGDVDYRIESAICKIFGTDAGFRGANHAMQIHGGNGFIAEYPFERVVRDMRIASIFEGTNEVLRCFVALTGLRPLGDELKAAMTTAGFLPYLGGKLRRQLLPGPLPKLPGSLAEEAAMISDGSVVLREAAEWAIRKYRKDVVKVEMALKRIADIAADLFLISACVSRTAAAIAAKGEPGASRELDVTRIFCREAWARILRNDAEKADNTDAQLLALADATYADGGYKMNAML